MIIEILLLVPLVTGILCYLLKNRRAIEAVSTVGSALVLALGGYTVYEVFTSGIIDQGIWFVDGLSAYMLAIISFIGFMVALYSLGYIGREYDDKEIDLGKVRYYYLFLHVFIFTMILVCVSNNLGIMWIAIEATTLASAFLVGFYDRDTSVEAAWKYIIICSVGITLALLGTILAYASSINALGESSNALNWSVLAANAGSLDPTLLKLSFVLILIGYGTKVGLAPMHTWLPDAHSQAPTPISALLSGVLLNCAMYGILRYHIIMTRALGPGFSGTLLLIFGFLSLLTAAAFIILQKDYKRLLAYSSIEHMGIIAIGFGIGGPIAIFGALLHMLNHALTKTLMFFGAGNILQKFKTKNIAEVRGIATLMPATAVLFLAGAFAITGSPPFSIFISEFTILWASISQGDYIVSALYIILLTAIFGGFIYYVTKMVFGEPAPGTIKGEVSRTNLVVMAFLAIMILIMGLYIPAHINSALNSISAIFTGGSL
jgi:hydrogenase-4 component F